MPTQLARFTSKCVDLSQKSVIGEPQPPPQTGGGGYADWVIVAIHCFREYLDQPYRWLLDIFHEMPRITAKPVPFRVDKVTEQPSNRIRRKTASMLE